MFEPVLECFLSILVCSSFLLFLLANKIASTLSPEFLLCLCLSYFILVNMYKVTFSSEKEIKVILNYTAPVPV